MVVVVVILVEVNDEEIGSMEITEEIILQKLGIFHITISVKIVKPTPPLVVISKISVGLKQLHYYQQLYEKNQ